MDPLLAGALLLPCLLITVIILLRKYAGVTLSGLQYALLLVCLITISSVLLHTFVSNVEHLKIAGLFFGEKGIQRIFTNYRLPLTEEAEAEVPNTKVNVN